MVRSRHWHEGCFSCSVLQPPVRWPFVVALLAGAPACGSASSFDGEASDLREDSDPREEMAVDIGVFRDRVKVFPDRLVVDRYVMNPALLAAIQEYARRGQTGEPGERVIIAEGRSSYAVDERGWLVDGSSNPLGFIRRAVDAIDDGRNITIRTEPATIAEYFEELSENGSIAFGVGDPAHAEANSAALPPEPPLADELPQINLGEMVLINDDAVSVRVVEGSLGLSIDVNADLVVAQFRAQSAAIEIGAVMDARLVVDVTTSEVASREFETEVFHSRAAVGAIGPIPITAEVTVSLSCQVEATGEMGVRVGGAASSDVFAALRYDRADGATMLAEGNDVELSLVGPALTGSAGVEVRCALVPRVDLLFFDLVGPFVEPEAWTAMGLATPDPALAVTAGIDIRAGGTLQFFSSELAAVETTVVSYEEELWRQSL